MRPLREEVTRAATSSPLLEAARSSNVPSAGVLPAFRRFQRSPAHEDIFFATDAHYTRAGHAIVAEVASELLTSEGLLPEARLSRAGN